MNQMKGSSVQLDFIKPFNFSLTLNALHAFEPTHQPLNYLTLATKINDTVTQIKITKDPKHDHKITVTSSTPCDEKQLLEVAKWILFTELDLKPMYSLAGSDPKLDQIIKKLYGLKPTRPVSLFEMAIVAITEQQISLAAAYKIRSRVIQRYGEAVGDQWVFPEPLALATASIEDLRSCGLSRQKADYMHSLAVNIVDGSVNLDSLKLLSDEDAREMIIGLRGFGRWSADYILVRGLARPDCVPVDDLAVRGVVGEYLGDGSRVSPSMVLELLEPFRPYRGLLAFYLLAAHRLGLTPA